jgi:hypothetical protein
VGAAASPPPQPASRMLNMKTNRRMHTSIVKSLTTQYHLTRRTSSTLMLGLVTALTLLIAACGGDSGTGPSGGVVGSYQLTTVQGKGLPYRLYSDVNYSVDVADGTIAINGDGNFLATMRSEERVENHLSVYADTATGKWSLSGTSIDFLASDGTRTTGKISGKSITLTDSSGVTPVVFVYTQK